MKKYELKLTKRDIKKINSKRNLFQMAFFVAFMFFGLMIYVMKPSTPIFFKGMVYFFFVILVYKGFRFFFRAYSNADLKNQVKMVTKVKIIDKKIKKRGGGKNRKTYYELLFEGNTDIKKYPVKRKMYDQVKIGDVMDFEYCKTSLQVLKLEMIS